VIGWFFFTKLGENLRHQEDTSATSFWRCPGF